MNPLIEYYTNQAGTGITPFSGVRYQKGAGFFGRLVTKTILPLLRMLGKKCLKSRS